MSINLPPTVQDYLDSGAELRDDAVPGLYSLEDLVASVVPSRRWKSADDLRDEARGVRETAEVFARSDLDPDRVQSVVTMFLWEAELYENPDVADRFEAALPPDLLAKWLAIASDKVATDLLVDPPDVYDCWVCGETRIDEPAVAVVEHKAERDKADSVICIACLEDAIGRARSAS